MEANDKIKSWGKIREQVQENRRAKEGRLARIWKKRLRRVKEQPWDARWPNEGEQGASSPREVSILVVKLRQG